MSKHSKKVSKTAAKSSAAGAVPARDVAVVVPTPEKAIASLRNLRANRLWVPPQLIDILLAEYDASQEEIAELKAKYQNVARFQSDAG